MLAEKENWIPRTVAPYMWVKQECGHDTSASNDKTSARISVDGSGLTPQNQHGAKSIVEPSSSQSFVQLSTPFLEAYIMQQTEDLKELPASSIENENRDETREEKTEDITLVHLNRKKIGKREKMFDLRKRMSEKLEEKRQLIPPQMPPSISFHHQVKEHFNGQTMNKE
ncbi:hypothetical protein Ahy_B05g074194 isoform F [Arachis hypogaea]|uniref:Uncharacterized protein n=1 Tax=Arachis hypogaea TaxID=3818 RepID=A0A444YY64_ARAHY|nr:hypothetical protein Ahy_B05g074194 isoform F [Arachis hypogaea]